MLDELPSVRRTAIRGCTERLICLPFIAAANGAVPENDCCRVWTHDFALVHLHRRPTRCPGKTLHDRRARHDAGGGWESHHAMGTERVAIMVFSGGPEPFLDVPGFFVSHRQFPRRATPPPSRSTRRRYRRPIARQ